MQEDSRILAMNLLCGRAGNEGLPAVPCQQIYDERQYSCMFPSFRAGLLCLQKIDQDFPAP